LYRYSVSQSSEFCRHNPLCCFSMSVLFFLLLFISLSTQSGNFWIHPRMMAIPLHFLMYLSFANILLAHSRPY